MSCLDRLETLESWQVPSAQKEFGSDLRRAQHCDKMVPRNSLSRKTNAHRWSSDVLFTPITPFSAVPSQMGCQQLPNRFVFNRESVCLLHSPKGLQHRNVSSPKRKHSLRGVRLDYRLSREFSSGKRPRLGVQVY